ncbi:MULTISPECIES: hypothetical protein [unclassified Acidocella]|uniref:hypothetical protein n=1 Tax=unclassified Acidocella TaxID=2648610 RepID=UPI00028E3218|nr:MULTISPECIES: hypothetical protein [unclassified Acidocella]EKN01085.1 hypothetical protein MXAZACID_02229 [Acidocella sp. MX-AZ02]WBO60588.1 hypothetical protein GT370_07395 [Acidocella sp. MX-AZ03]
MINRETSKRIESAYLEIAAAEAQIAAIEGRCFDMLQEAADARSLIRSKEEEIKLISERAVRNWFNGVTKDAPIEPAPREAVTP